MLGSATSPLPTEQNFSITWLVQHIMLVIAALFLQSQAKLTGVESQVNAVVASVFSERYRDVVEDVRVCCIKELGTWIKEYK